MLIKGNLILITQGTYVEKHTNYFTVRYADIVGVTNAAVRAYSLYLF
jgi:hypothetical protein